MSHKDDNESNNSRYQFLQENYKNYVGQNESVSFDNLGKLMKDCGLFCTQAELQDLVNEVEIDEYGNINFDSFIDIVNKKEEENETEEELRNAFEIFDKNKNGLISANNLLSVFKKIDDTIQPEEMLLMIRECDIDGDGYLNFEEFCRMMKNK